MNDEEQATAGGAKVGASAAIIAYLVIAAQRNNAFSNLYQQPKDWGFLVLACVLLATSLLLTIVRWLYLVRVVEIPFTLKNALRLGFLGYLWNLAPLGIVGGDLLKGGMLAWENPGRRARAFASIIVDRLVGLYLLFVIASIGVLASGFWLHAPAGIQLVCRITLALTVVGGIACAAMLTPAMTEGRFSRWLCGLPRLGPHAAHLFEAVRLYRRNPGVLVLASVITVGVHTLGTLSVYFVARGLLPGSVLPLLAAQFVAVPLSNVAACFPLPAGPFEAVLTVLYATVPLPPGMVRVTEWQGLMVALAYRIMTVLIAVVGICYYIASRREVSDVLKEAEQPEGASPLPIDEPPSAGSCSPCQVAGHETVERTIAQPNEILT